MPIQEISKVIKTSCKSHHHIKRISKVAVKYPRYSVKSVLLLSVQHFFIEFPLHSSEYYVHNIIHSPTSEKKKHCAKKPVTTMLTIPLEMYSFTL